VTQHYQRNVRGVLKWCPTCGHMTMHRVDDRRVGCCLEQHFKGLSKAEKKKVRTSQVFQNSAPHPTQKPWDYVFGQRKPYWVIVTLKDGSKIAGSYDSNSFSSSAPAEEQLYLEETWVLNADGGFDRPRDSTKGIIILSGEMVSIELFSKE
jgi:hypothetical protein